MRHLMLNKRKQLNLSQLELANIAEVDRTMINKIENGTAQPSVSTAKKIANTLQIRWTYFFKNVGENNSL